MQAYGEQFKDKKITVLGLGLLGRGVGDVEFLAKCGAQVLVTDKKSEQELASSVERLRRYPNISFHLGGHRIDDFTHCDMVLKAAGVRLDSKEVAAARAAGIPVVMSTALFAKYAMEIGATVVGVTGTRGKSTVSHMIYHTIKNAGRRVHLGGNVRGISTLAMLPEIKPGDIAVLELDSWQLQGFGNLRISPHVAVFTNLMPDHQNYYQDMNTYFTDKANIFRFQHRGDTLIIGEAVATRVRAAVPPVEPIVPGALAPDWNLRVIGEHNRHNASYVAAALLALGLTSDKIRAGLESFEGVEGRLQLIAERNGVKIYNDNNATTPEATVAALRALNDGPRRSIILITGGSEKGLELGELVAEIRESVSKLVLLTHPQYAGSERFATLLEKEGIRFERATSLAAAVDTAMSSTFGTVLFSPAFASFGMFKNEYERNDQFVKLVQEHV